jgi:hypothetical protein
MLMKVVFPAPFDPMTPTISPSLIVTLMLAAAVTAPKLLTRPLVSRMVVMLQSLLTALWQQGPEPLGQEEFEGTE